MSLSLVIGNWVCRKDRDTLSFLPPNKKKKCKCFQATEKLGQRFSSFSNGLNYNVLIKKKRQEKGFSCGVLL